MGEGISLVSEATITEIKARQVLDSRGNPTVEAEVFTQNGCCGRAIVPSGASKGVHEAVEIRDKEAKFYGGKGVSNAVDVVNKEIKSELIGQECTDQRKVDEIMIALDGTENKERLGANSILAVSMAVSRTGAAVRQQSLYRYLRNCSKYRLPVPMMNVINGGKHAGNRLVVQEFLIEPIGTDSFSDAIRLGAETYHTLGSILIEKYGSSAINVGDEGGYAPQMQSTRDALDTILSAIITAGHSETEIKLGLDPASSNFYNSKDSTYKIDGKNLSSGQLEDYYADLVSTYPIATLEDPFEEEAYSDFASITMKLGKRIRIIGDDIYVTNKKRIEKGIREDATNAVLIKLNQIGTVTETLEAIQTSEEARYEVVVSHRSGETEDTYISHLATAVGSKFIKAGAPARGERTAKYNEILRIEEELEGFSFYAGRQ